MACTILLLGAAPAGPGAPAATVPGPAPAPVFQLDGVERVVAISDIHGAHRAFLDTLAAAGVIDAAGAWAAGRTHLVIVGDVLDRGDDSRASLDLLMRLEGQAAAAGGRLHFVLGNHEVMNLVGDLRYVSKGEFAAFAPEETAAMRDAAFAGWARRAPASGLPPARADFDARFPPGFFAHRAAFGAGGKYGRWLLGKPLALRVNDTLFVHAGVGRALAGTTLEAINGPLRDELVEYVTLYAELAARGLVDATLDFYDVPAAVGLSPGPPKPAGGEPAAAQPEPDPRLQRLVALHGSMVHSQGSPLWYRGNVGCGPLVEQERIAGLLKSLGARRVVIGHTPTPARQVWRRLDDRVWMIDTGMNRSFYAGRGSALVLEGTQATAIYQGGGRAVAVEALDDRAGALSAGLPAVDLEAALAGGEVAARAPAADGELLTLRWRGSELQAVFRPERNVFPEAAAYRVDRLLGLAMVPAAVVRTLDGATGSLQYVPQSLVTEGRRTAGDARIDAWCPLKDQWQAMYVFDAIIGNAPRTADELAYVPASGQLVLSGHRRAFGTGGGVPPHLQQADLSMNGLWKLRIGALEAPEGRDRLLEVMPRRQYEALVKRARALAAR